MALVMRYSMALANAQTQLITQWLEHGVLRMYSAPMPETVDDAPTGELLLELSFGSPAFGEPVNGAAAAESMPGAYALTSGRAAWYRTLRQDGAAVFDGTVGLSDANLVLDQIDLEQGALVTIQGFTYVSPTE